MLDTVFEGATVVDGTGAEPFTADVGLCDGRIVTIGRVTEAARERIAAHGAWLTPGFVDLHTHYDGQATWDETFSPSIHHGTTTVLMGNCGVGFAPRVPGREADLIALMEGVEDIPGVALAEGIRWRWESFPQFMDALDAMPHSLDFGVQVPHDPLRMAVLGDRAVAQQAATANDIATMRALLAEALDAGALGFSTGRTDNHRTAAGHETPASEAGADELTGIVAAFQGRAHGVVQMVSDFDLLRGPERFGPEFDLVEAVAQAAGRPLSMTWLQRDPGGAQWQAIQARVEAAVARGLPLYLQAAPRGIGVIVGLDASFHPFMGFPGYKEIAHMPLAERAAALRDPARRARILGEQSERLAGDGTPIPPLVDILLAQIERISARMFPLGERPDYEPPVTASFYVRAKQAGTTALAALYDHFAAGDGSALVYFPIFNYNDGNLDAVRTMLTHPRALWGLSDAGAHVGTVCDASNATFLLSHWVRDRPHDRLPLAQAVHLLSGRNAAYLGLADRGRIAEGLRADLNLIDPQRLQPGTPRLVRDLPAGGRRFLQCGEGYLGTWVAGQAVQRDGKVTDARPGRLIRGGR
ncbi:N-acyl-D-amino-acid deacylase family protein [Rubrivivax albus]|uniref:D-aminoacylase n=1 Tax=Rubrivivax albus TaxID=2499835 RepID=A0A3S2U3Q1_9BURK|nr:amidohydrolase family protein [Rubrivivax albus]RVT52315.1 D-aminoacylase [Rubrivivax albus]